MTEQKENLYAALIIDNKVDQVKSFVGEDCPTFDKDGAILIGTMEEIVYSCQAEGIDFTVGK